MKSHKFPNVLITGSAGDIGSGLSACFLERGHRVLGLDIAACAPEHLREKQHFYYECCDLTNPEVTREKIKRFVETHGEIQIIINNVGLIYNKPIVSYLDGKLTTHSNHDWNKVISVTLTTAFHVTASCVQHILEKSEGGIVINISSISADGNPGQSAYSAAKGAINSMTKAQAKELGAFGIRVAAIAPGFIDTSSTIKAMGSEGIKKLKRSIPLRRLGTVSEVCHAAVFIVENEYFTGSILELNGGLSI